MRVSITTFPYIVGESTDRDNLALVYIDECECYELIILQSDGLTSKWAFRNDTVLDATELAVIECQ